jgi:hypothetical protein
MATAPPTIPTTAEPVQPKPGMKTTEFILSTIAVLLGAFMASELAPGPQSGWSVLAGAILAGLGAAGYSVSRGMTKAAAHGTGMIQRKPPPDKD